MFWVVQQFPRCDHHAFLSHCAEDRSALVHPVYAGLVAHGVRPWLDRHHYPYGRGSRGGLRDAILSCRHVVFFVTDAMLTQARGWCAQELAWAELLQDNLIQPGGPDLQAVLLPLYFVDPADPRLPRSVWQSGRDRGAFCPAGSRPEAWAVEQIVAFLGREERQAARLGRMARSDAGLHAQLKARPGLDGRVLRFSPKRLRAPTPPD